MPTAEELAFSIQEEGKGIHVLLWSDKDDLFRALIVLTAALDRQSIKPMLVTSTETSFQALRKLIELRSEIRVNSHSAQETKNTRKDEYWMVFIQQAVSKIVGPWLNGWRKPISESPGSLLIIRTADFDSFQRKAPDLASFYGPRIFTAEEMYSKWDKSTHDRLQPILPPQFNEILDQLPGQKSDRVSIEKWLDAYNPYNWDEEQ